MSSRKVAPHFYRILNVYMSRNLYHVYFISGLELKIDNRALKAYHLYRQVESPDNRMRVSAVHMASSFNMSFLPVAL